jgi:hypothetical protein
MKKIICIIAVVLLIVSVVYAQKKAGITAKDLAGMKGTYTGMLSFGSGGGMEAGGTSACTFELLNDAVPIKGKLTVASVPNVLASSLGISTNPAPMQNDDGVLTTQGTIMFMGAEKNWFEVMKSGDKKIKVYYYFRGLKGDGTLTKK